MKAERILPIVLVTLLFISCAPKQIIPQISFGNSPADKMFAKAEKRFDAKLYSRALELYSDYLILYYDQPLAPAALLKIGMIYLTQRNYEQARAAFTRIITEYPNSYFAPDGRVSNLATYYNEGRYIDVIKKADEIDDDAVSSVIIIRKYAVVGDAHIAMGAYAKGINSFITAYKKTKDPERKSVVEQLKKAISRLPASEIESFLPDIEDKTIKNTVLFQLGLRHAREDKYEKAIDNFAHFISEFPRHKDAPSAQNMIEELNKRSVYNHNAIGCLLPLSGKYKIFGDRALKGIELAMEQFSRTGINQEIEIYIEDTGADPDTAVLGVQKLAQANVAAIIGPIMTADTAAVQANQEKIPMITLTQKENIAEIGDYVFRNFLTPRMQIETIVSYAVEELGLSRFAVLYPDEQYGITFMNMFWDEVIAYGGEIVGAESYDASHTDFAAPIKKLVGLHYDVPKDLKAAEELVLRWNDRNHDVDIEPYKPEAIVDFDAVFIPDGPEKAGLILPQLVYYDVNNVYLFGTNLWHSDRLIEMAKHHVQGAVIPEVFFAESDTENVRTFVSAFESAFGDKPGFIEAVAYDSAMLLFNMVSQPAIRFKTAIKERLKTMEPFSGTTGLTSFDRNGDADKKLYLLKVQGNNFVELTYE